MATPEVEIGPITIEDNPVSLDTAGGDPVPNPVSLDVNGGAGNVPLSDSVSATRAYKAALGSQKYGNTYNSVKDALKYGQEDNVRAQTSAQIQLERDIARNKLITTIAAQRGASLTPEDIDLIDRNLDSLTVSTDPDSVFEELYAKQHVQEVKNAALRMGDTDLQRVAQVDPAIVDTAEELTNTLLAKTEFARKEAENMEHLVKDQSWAGYLADFAKQFFPGYYEFKMRSNTPGVGFLEGGLLGENLDAQRKKLAALPLREYKTQLRGTLDELKRDNPQVAYAFAMAMTGQDTTDKQFNNAMSALELATNAPLAKLLSKPFRGLRGAYKDVLDAAAGDDISKSTVVEATGDLETAATKKVAENVVEEVGDGANPTKRAIESLFSTFRLDKDNLGSNLGTATQNAVTKIEEQFTSFTNSFRKALEDTAKVKTATGLEDAEAAAKVLFDMTKQLYPGLKNNLLDVTGPEIDKLNVARYRMNFGDLHGLLFTEDHTAHNWAKANGFENFTIVRKGLGYYISVEKNLDLTDNLIRDLSLRTPGAKDPTTYLDLWGTGDKSISKLRTAEEILSPEHRANRLVAAYTPAAVKELMAEWAKKIDSLAKGRIDVDRVTGEALPRFQRYKLSPVERNNRWNDFKRVVEQARYTPDPDNDMKLGYFFKDNAELDYAYMKTVKRLPDYAEREAYFTFKQLAEADRTLRNLALYRLKARHGVETHNIKFKNADGDWVDSPDFDGARRRDFPTSDDDNILIVNEDGKVSNRPVQEYQGKSRDKLRKDVKEGKATVFEIWDTEAKPLADLPNAENSRIRYVMSYSSKSRPISTEQVPRRGGGHFDYDYDLYLKQAKITPAFDKKRDIFKHWYEGDVTIMPIAVRQMGKDILEKLEKVRMALDLEDVAGAKMAAKDLPIQWSEIHSWFLPQKDLKTGKINPPRLSTSEPIRLVGKNQKISEMDNELPTRYLSKDRKSTTFVDGTKQGSMARQSQVEYTGQRDADMLHTINNVGTKYNPIFNWERANMIDPITSMNRALTKITNSTFMDDYKFFAYENWLRNAENWIKDPLQARNSPLWAFNHAEYKADIPLDVKNRLEASRARIKQFIGIANPLETTMQRFSQNLVDSVYNRLGNNGVLLKMAHELPQSKFALDPIGTMRSFVFHKVLGLFNPVQLAKQVQTYSSIWSLSPRQAPSATSGALLTYWTRFNRDPAFLKALDEKMSRLQIPGFRHFRAGEFEESVKIMDNTGFGIVQGEHAALDREITVNLVRSGFRTFLDGGLMFFRGGERMVRFGAWHSAYLEFRAANPTAKIGAQETRNILQRADLLYGNMSRASSSTINEGAFSLPSQFVAYSLRQAELFAGKRLTPLERTRLFLGHSLLYGVGGGIGVATGLPLADMLREYATKNGYVIGDNFLKTFAMEGGIATLIAALSGGGNPKKGTYYNVGESWSVQGITQLRDALRSDHSWLEVMTGAMGSSIGNIFQAADPYFKMVGDYMGFYNGKKMGDMSRVYKPTGDEVVQMLKEINSVNKGFQAWTSAYYGTWESKRGELLQKNVSMLDTVWRYISGLQPQEVSNVQVMRSDLKTQEELQKEGLKRFIQHYQRAIRYADTDPEAANKNFSNAFFYLMATGYPLNKYATAISIASRGMEDALTRTSFDYYIRKAAPENAEMLSDAFAKTQQLRETKGN